MVLSFYKITRNKGHFILMSRYIDVLEYNLIICVVQDEKKRRAKACYPIY